MKTQKSKKPQKPKKAQEKDPDYNPQALKHLFGQDLLKRISESIESAYPSFDRKRFLGLFHQLKTLEMKPRVQLIRDELRKLLPQDYPKALEILLKSSRTGKLNSFDLWPYSDFVQTYGIEHFKISLNALKELTQLFSSEFAIRPFLVLYPEETLKFLTQCAQDKNVDIRRWASEGTRPRLPWGLRLQEFVKDPSATLPLLELLKFDPELYVRKSVSNHLNDIAKDHPEKVIQILSKWKNEAGPDHSSKIEWIIHRALRTLIKSGHPGALHLIGVSQKVKIKFTGLKINQRIFQLGEKIEFEFKIQSLSNQSQKIVVDYIVHFVRANQKSSPKVFKLKTIDLPAKKEITITKTHHLKKVTTREHYPGVHILEIQVNGRVSGRMEWELLE